MLNKHRHDNVVGNDYRRDTFIQSQRSLFVQSVKQIIRQFATERSMTNPPFKLETRGGTRVRTYRTLLTWRKTRAMRFTADV